MNPMMADEIPSMSMLTSSGNPSVSLNEHAENKFMTDAYCTHLAMKNKFVDKYDSTNLHQLPDDFKEDLFGNKENLLHTRIATVH